MSDERYSAVMTSTERGSGPRLILVGPPGSGKSTVGRTIATRLDVPFHDFDDDLESSTGVEAGELVVQLGREGFRDLESKVLSKVLPHRTGVFALGGGTPTSPGVPDLICSFPVVFLDVDLEHLLKREGLMTLHPWLMPNPRAHLRTLLEERRPVYTAVADLSVQTSGRSVSDIADDILAGLDGVLAKNSSAENV